MLLVSRTRRIKVLLALVGRPVHQSVRVQPEWISVLYNLLRAEALEFLLPDPKCYNLEIFADPSRKDGENEKFSALQTLDFSHLVYGRKAPPTSPGHFVIKNGHPLCSHCRNCHPRTPVAK